VTRTRAELTPNHCTISAVVSPVAGNRSDNEDWQAKPHGVKYGGLVQSMELSHSPPGAKSQSDAWLLERHQENRSGVPEDWLSADTVDAGSFQRQQHGCAGNELGTGSAKRQRRTPPQISSSICMVQINLQHCRAAASVLCKLLSEYETVIALVQEPWIRKEKILGLNTKGINLFRGCLTDHPRTCVLIKG